ncbi:hypothetical protein GQ600_26250 [Phytophthora cactorum]|nr:hypothetical protein GQ600_26250 [Phytophthora cactorum]
MLRLLDNIAAPDLECRTTIRELLNVEVRCSLLDSPPTTQQPNHEPRNTHDEQPALAFALCNDQQD